VGRVEEREEVADGERLNALVAQAAGLGAHLRLVQRDQDPAARVQPLADPHPPAARRQERRRLRVHVQVVHARALLPAQLEHVLESLGHEDRGHRARLLEDRVGRDGRPVNEARHRAGLAARERQHRADRVAHAAEEILRRGRHLGEVESPVAVEGDDVGEGAADVDADL
jgi:hypothetical protein